MESSEEEEGREDISPLVSDLNLSWSAPNEETCGQVMAVVVRGGVVGLLRS